MYACCEGGMDLSKDVSGLTDFLVRPRTALVSFPMTLWPVHMPPRPHSRTALR